MTEKNYAYYNVATGLIDNIIVLTDENALTIAWPEGFAVVVIPDGGISGQEYTIQAGWSYVNGQFIEQPIPEPPPETEQPISQGAQTL